MKFYTSLAFKDTASGSLVFTRNVVVMLILFNSVATVYSQNPAEKLEVFYEKYAFEKIYCSIDKPYYLQGDRLWGAAYLVDASYHIFIPHGVVYVDLINPKGEVTQSLTLKAEGKPIPFTFDLDDSISPGTYILRSYTQYQKNFPPEFIYQQEIPIVSSLEMEEVSLGRSLKMEFYPEGGYMVNGLQGKIGFIAKDELNVPIDLEGKIVNQEGDDVLSFESWTEGIGMFVLTPEHHYQYSAIVEYKDSVYHFDLPKALKQGSNFSVSSVRNNEIFIEARSADEEGLKNNRITIQSRGLVQLDQVITEPQTYKMLVDKSTLPQGLLHVTLFDAGNRTIAERLVYNHYKRDDPIDIEISEQNLQVEDSTAITIEKVNSEYRGYGSVSIYLNSIFEGSFEHAHIVSYLLLQSDLDRDIAGLDAFVHSSTSKNRALLDAVLMTYGWKRFDWQLLLEDKGIEIIHPTESSLNIGGQVMNKSGRSGISADVIVTVLDDEDFEVLPIVTDETGIFYVDGFQFTDTTEVLVQASKHSKRSARKNDEDKFKRIGEKDVLVNLFDLASFKVDTTYTNKVIWIPKKPIKEEQNDVSLDKKQAVAALEPFLDQGWSIDLEEVTVSGRKMNKGQLREAEVKRRYEEKGLFYFSSTDKFLTENAYLEQYQINTIQDLIRRVVPGARMGLSNGIRRVVFGSYDAPTVPMIVVDGVIMDENQLNLVNPANVAVVEVINGLRARALYGSSFVLSLATYDEGEIAKIPSKGTVLIEHPGFFQAATFSSFMANRTNDFPPSTTIYWNPSVDLSEQFHARFETGVLAGTYRIKVEGLSKEGEPFYMTKDLVIRESVK